MTALVHLPGDVATPGPVLRPTLGRRLFDLVAPEREAVRPPLAARRGSPPEIRVLALVSLAAYLVAGWYLRHVLHFAVGDALARTANAKYILFARDAHFGALGFVWMPIPTVSQLPFMLVMHPLGYAADVGWVTTAVWGAGTVLVLGRLCRDLGVPRPVGLAIVATYALNPVTAYYAANGMSEGPLFFFVALTFLGLLRYLRDGDSAALVTLGFGLAGCALDRYEAIPLVVAVGGIVLVADLRRSGRHAATLSTALATLPAIASVALWFLYMRVIKGSFRAFITDAAGNYTSGGAAPATGAAPGATAAPPAAPQYTFYKDVANGLDWWHYTLHWCFAYAPALVLLPLLLIPPLRRTVGAVAVIVFALWLPGVTAYLLRFGGSAGDPRYFTSVIVTATIGVIFLASRVTRRPLQLVLHPLLVAVLALGWVTGTHAQWDRASTAQEQEWRVFDVLRGRVDTRDTRGIVADAALAKQVDALLRPGDRVMLDVRFTFEVELYSSKPKHFIINNDQDYDRIRADPYLPGRRIDYLVFPTGTGRGAGFDYAEAVYRADPSQWAQVPVHTDLPIAVYHRVRVSSAPLPAAGSVPQ